MFFSKYIITVPGGGGKYYSKSNWQIKLKIISN